MNQSLETNPDQPAVENPEHIALSNAIARMINGETFEEPFSSGNWKISNEGKPKNSLEISSADGKDSFDFTWKMENNEIIFENTERTIDKARLDDTLKMINGALELFAKNRIRGVEIIFNNVPEGEMKTLLLGESYKGDGGQRFHKRIVKSNLK